MNSDGIRIHIWGGAGRGIFFSWARNRLSHRNMTVGENTFRYVINGYYTVKKFGFPFFAEIDDM